MVTTKQRSPKFSIHLMEITIHGSQPRILTIVRGIAIVGYNRSYPCVFTSYVISIHMHERPCMKMSVPDLRCILALTSAWTGHDIIGMSESHQWIVTCSHGTLMETINPKPPSICGLLLTKYYCQGMESMRHGR